MSKAHAQVCPAEKIASGRVECNYYPRNAGQFISENCPPKSTKISSSVEEFHDPEKEPTSSRPSTRNDAQLPNNAKPTPGNIKEVETIDTQVDELIQSSLTTKRM